MTEYIHFEIAEEKPKTNVYNVLTNKTIIESGVVPHHILLGQIKWSPTWRQYVFCPETETDWSIGCLIQITNFLTVLYSDRKYKP